MRYDQACALQAAGGGLRDQRVAEPELVFVGDLLEPSVVADQRCGLALADRVDDHHRSRSKFGAGGKSFEFQVDAPVLAVPGYVQVRKVGMNVSRSTVAHLAVPRIARMVISPHGTPGPKGLPSGNLRPPRRNGRRLPGIPGDDDADGVGVPDSAGRDRPE